MTNPSRPIHHLLLLMLAAFLAVSCSNDPGMPSVPDIKPGETEDNFQGKFRDFEIEGFYPTIDLSDFVCKILAPDGTIITRTGNREYVNGEGYRFSTGLKEGTYRLLCFEYPTTLNETLSNLSDKFETAEIGLGCEIEVSEKEGIRVCQKYDSSIGMFGDGTKDSPYQISSYEHLFLLMMYVNNHDTNLNITNSTYFKQTVPINIYRACVMCDQRYGWYPIGADTTTPFRGVYEGNEISGLWCDRQSSAGIGLFGYLYNATIDGLTVTDSELSGNFAVGAVAGAVIAGGDEHGKSAIVNCNVSKTTLKGSKESFAVGGIVGCVDMHSTLLVGSCRNEDSSVSGSYNVGGIVGGSARYSCTIVNDCHNNSTVNSEYSGAGGIIGAADTLYVTSCRNFAPVTGASAYKDGDSGNSGIGVGGIAGGSGISFLTACRNEGEVKGVDGVGGIIGSTRIKGDKTTGDAYTYNNTLIRWCANRASVSGNDAVGGICGEAQFGCYGALNTGAVKGRDYVGGIVGTTSIAVAHNAVNTGNINGASYCSGIVGKTSWGSLALDSNYGEVSGTGSHTAGILGLGGNNTIVHYCGNHGSVGNLGYGPTGGVIAEIGDPREWTAMNITECVIGSLELVMAVAGPVLAVAEGIVEAGSEVAAAVIKVTEGLLDVALNRVDRLIWDYGLYEIISEETAEGMKASVTDVAMAEGDEIRADMVAIRGNHSFETGEFNATPLAMTYTNALKATLDYYETADNDERFNDRINETRIERMEHLEHVHHAKEIAHQVIAGVAIIASAVAIVGGMVASGGAAAPFIVMGSAAAIVGGTNAITKSCTDFKENAVVVSQCVNTGAISSSGGDCGGLIGVLQDNSILRNSLNAGPGSGSGDTFVGRRKNKVTIESCLSIADLSGWPSNGGGKDCIVWSKNPPSSSQQANYYKDHGIYYAGKEEIGNPSTYTFRASGHLDIYDDSMIYYSLFWDVDNPGSDWWLETSGSGYFPVPAYSEMRE